MMKLAYYFSRRRFGKVLTPLKVHSARLPFAFGLFYGKVGQLDKKLTLPPELVMLIREQVARKPGRAARKFPQLVVDFRHRRTTNWRDNNLTTINTRRQKHAIHGHS
jgi:hypothetical protein